jgi:hypothetical protein
MLSLLPHCCCLHFIHAEAPRGVCSRAFVEGGTHNANFDGVCFYPKWSLPGYAALFK